MNNAENLVKMLFVGGLAFIILLCMILPSSFSNNDKTNKPTVTLTPTPTIKVTVTPTPSETPVSVESSEPETPEEKEARETQITKQVAFAAVKSWMESHTEYSGFPKNEEIWYYVDGDKEGSHEGMVCYSSSGTKSTASGAESVMLYFYVGKDGTIHGITENGNTIQSDDAFNSVQFIDPDYEYDQGVQSLETATENDIPE